MRSRLPAVLTAILLFLFVSAFYWKLTLSAQYHWIAGGADVAQQVLPWFTEQARQWHQHIFPTWDPRTWLGQPILGQMQPGAAYPLNWLLCLLPLDSAGQMQDVFLRWYYVIIHVFSVWFCWLLCRDLSLSRPASLVGAMVFSLAGYMGTVNRPQMLNGAVWAPLVLLFLFRLVQGKKPISSAALGGLALGLSWLSGHHQVPLLLTFFSSVILAYAIWRGAPSRWARAAVACLLLAIAGLTSALQVLPAIDFERFALRWVGTPQPVGAHDVIPYSIHALHSFQPQHFAGFLFAGMHGEVDPFVGIVALALALLAAVTMWDRLAVRVFGAVAVGGLIYALGPNAGLQRIACAIIPTLNKARSPDTALLFCSLGVAVLAAHGVDSLLHSKVSTWRRCLMFGLIAFGLASLLVALFVSNGVNRNAIVLSGVLAIATAALFYLSNTARLSLRVAAVILPFLVMLDVADDSERRIPGWRDTWAMADLVGMRSNMDIARFLQSQPGPFRIETDPAALPLNWPMLHNLDNVHGYLAGVSEDVFRTEWFTCQVRSLFGVKYSVGPQPAMDGEVPAFTGASGVKVWQNPRAFPRAWSVHHLEMVRNRDEANAFIRDRFDRLHDSATLMGTAPALEACRGDTVSIVGYTAPKVTLRTTMNCRGMVVLADTMLPDWTATLDNTPVPVQEVDGALRGVVVPAGSHQLVFQYAPRSVQIGWILSLTGVVLAFLLLVMDWRRHHLP